MQVLAMTQTDNFVKQVIIGADRVPSVVLFNARCELRGFLLRLTSWICLVIRQDVHPRLHVRDSEYVSQLVSGTCEVGRGTYVHRSVVRARKVNDRNLRAIHTDQFSGTSSRCQSTCTSKLAGVSCQWYQNFTGASHWYQSVLI